MTKERTASGVACRFREEQEYIERYTRFLRSKSTIHDHQVRELNRILARVHIDLFPTRGYGRTAETFTPEETGVLLAAIDKAGPEVYQTILGHEQCLDDIPSFGLNGPAGDHLYLLDEWIQYVLERLPYDVEEQDEDAILQTAIREYEETGDQHLPVEDRIPPDELRALIILAIDHAKHIQVRQQVDAMVYAREQFWDIQMLARAAKPEAEINILRQSFLLLMTAFDASVFDIVRIALRRKFFDLIGHFGKDGKITLEEIGEAGSVEALQRALIEEQLKKRYVKDLLGLLQGLKVELVDKGDKAVQLIELVLRRNIHVHNRGVVDERYLEADSRSKKPKYNLFNLRLGDVACIDLAYLKDANRLCATCVDRLAKWADG